MSFKWIFVHKTHGNISPSMAKFKGVCTLNVPPWEQIMLHSVECEDFTRLWRGKQDVSGVKSEKDELLRCAVTERVALGHQQLFGRSKSCFTPSGRMKQFIQKQKVSYARCSPSALPLQTVGRDIITMPTCPEVQALTDVLAGWECVERFC